MPRGTPASAPRREPRAREPAEGPADPHHHPHESHCTLLVILNTPLALAEAALPPVLIGVSIAPGTPPGVSVERLRLPARLDCRDPPACTA